MKPKFVLAGLLLLSLIILSLGSILPAINQSANENNKIKDNDVPPNKISINDVTSLLINTSTPTSTNPTPTNITPTSSKNSLQNELTLFYGDGCPHCALVEAYLKENPSKFNLKQKEVYYNEANQKELALRAKYCGLQENKIGVPFLWTGSDCIIGDQPIINYFKQLSK
jgi:glutaredoxin